ncbi:MAG: DNA glycosylase, partial [Bacillota bacterium]|nr:DNA glycosylase [Bacillota bacterium]
MKQEYKVTEKDGVLEIAGIRDFHLDHIFDCGQCFRWEKDLDGSYSGIAHGKVLTVSYEPGETSGVLRIAGATAADFDDLWRDYFDLDRDYGAIKVALSKEDPVMAKAIAYGHGIRILNQEPWETLISFIISQNNNIPRIKKCIDSLAETVGEPIDAAQASAGAAQAPEGALGGRKYYSLPSPEALAACSLEDLAPCRLGYRAKYLIETARQVKEAGLESLEALSAEGVSPEDALEALGAYCGVGPKVANCVALFSMKKFSSFPIDVWVRKVMHQLYGLDEKDMKGMAHFAAERFGQHGGIAQQYLFYYITHN